MLKLLEFLLEPCPACFLESATLLEVLSGDPPQIGQPLGALMYRMEDTYLRQFSYHFIGISSSAASLFSLVLGSWDFPKSFFNMIILNSSLLFFPSPHQINRQTLLSLSLKYMTKPSPPFPPP